MDTQPDPRVVSVNHLDNGAVVTFEDGKSAFYPAALLYSLLSQTKSMSAGADEWLQPD